jgi:glutamate racemase
MADSLFVKKCVDTFLDQNIPKAQNIVLGCTHYIFLKDYIRTYYGDKIEIFDGNVGTALQLKNTLESLNCLAEELIESDDARIVVFNTKSEDNVTKSYNMLATLGKGI